MVRPSTSEAASAAVGRSAGAVVVRHPINRGVGGATVTGIEAALRLGAAHIVTMDADGTPAFSAATLTRNTAGVQLPQQPLPDTTPSMRCIARASGRAFTNSRSSGPCRLPKTS